MTETAPFDQTSLPDNLIMTGFLLLIKYNRLCHGCRVLCKYLKELPDGDVVIFRRDVLP